MSSPDRNFLVKRLGIALASILGLLLVAVLTAGLWLPPIARLRLIELVDERSGGQYALQLGDLDLGLWAGSVSAKDVSFAPTSHRAALDSAAQMTGGTIVAAELAQARLSGINWWSLIFSRQLEADLFALDKPRFSLTTYESSSDSDTGKTDNRSDSTSSSGPLGQKLAALHISEVQITGAYVDWGHTLDSVDSEMSVDGLNLTVRDLRLDSFSIREQPTRVYDSFTLGVRGVRYELPDSVHVVEFARAEFDSRGGQLRLASFGVSPRISDHDFLALADGPPGRLDLTATEVLLDDFRLGEFLRKRTYRARTFRTDSLTADVLLAAPSSGGRQGGGNTKLGVDLRLDSLDLRGMRLSLRRAQPATTIEVPQAELLLVDIRTHPDSSRPELQIADAEMRINAFDYAVPGTDQVVGFERAVMNYAGRSAAVDGLRYGPADESRSRGSKRLTLVIEAERVALAQLDVEALWTEGRLSAKQVTVEGFELEANTNLTIASTRNGARIPHELVELHKLPIDLALAKVEVERAQIRYRRITADTDVTLSFEDTYASIYDVYTAPGRLSPKPAARATADIRTVFEGKLPVQVKILWPNGSGVPYDLEASTGAIDLARVNDIVEPLAKIRIESGRLERLAFDFRADERRGSGRLTASYKGFRINLLDKSGDDKDVLSLISNVAAVNEDSAGRSGPISDRREDSESMWAHWWELIRSGLVEVALTDLGESQMKKQTK